MAAGHPLPPERARPGSAAALRPEGSELHDAGAPLSDFERWSAPLQQACRLEAERGFTDLLGRQETFSSFIARSLAAPPATLPTACTESLTRLSAAFATYRDRDLGQRQQLVRLLRQSLHQLKVQLRPTPTLAPPRLRLAPSQNDRAAAGAVPASPQFTPATPLAEVRGIGARVATRLAGLGLLVVADLVRHYPRDYLDYAHLVRISGLEAGRTATVLATVRRCHAFPSPRNPNLAILELHLQDATGRLRVSRFFAGRRFTAPAWLKAQQRQFPPGATVAVSGLVRESPWGPGFHDPLLEVLESPGATLRSETIGRLVAVYALTEGLSADVLRRSLAAVLPHLGAWSDPLSARLRSRLQLLPLAEALRGIHQPRKREDLEASRRRLVFDELLLLQLALAQRRQRLRQRQAPALAPAPTAGEGLLDALRSLLPYRLTAAQERVLAEIRHDLAKPQPMARLLQGDVGSGKTVVALAALLCAIEAGWQGALMAPTEVLAEQHMAKLHPWLSQLHLSAALLTGSTPAKRRRELLTDLANGQ
ncbi:MAG: DEAD/DEAH box helicase, partial [Cyanobium sp.]